MSVNKRLANGTLMPIAGLGTYENNDLKQYTTLPTASSANEGLIVQYVGTDSTNYSIGGIYQCQENSGTYSWVLLQQEIDVDDAISSTSENPVQNKVIKAALDDKIDIDDIGVAGGVAELDSNGLVPSSQLPSYVDDIVEGYYNSTDGKFYKESTYTTEITGEAGKIYVSLDTTLPYRWSGSAFVEIPWGLALGETSTTAYRGDRGKTAYDHSQNPYTSNPTEDGTASAGSSSQWARGDHVHPHDSTKVDKVTGKGLSTNDFTDALKTKLDGLTVNNGTLTIQKNGTNVQTFTANQSSNATCNITMTTTDVGIFNGTSAAWAALSAADKAKYTIVILTDD